MRSLHVDQGFPDPFENCLQLQRVVRGIKRSQSALPSRPCPPVSSNILCIIYSGLDLNSFDDDMFWAACLLAYFGLLRSLSPAHQPSTQESICPCPMFLWMFLSTYLAFVSLSKLLKLTPFEKRCNILIGLVSSPLCAVQAVVSYLAQHGHCPGPLFLLHNAIPLTRSLVTDRLRAILLSSGLPGDFSSHGFRIGAATSAARAGVPDHLIQVLGRWKSDAYKQCIRTPPDLIICAAKSLVE